MPSNLAYVMALVTMTCGHKNTYGKPWPIKAELAWCERCYEFRLVTKISRFSAPNRERGTTYNKSSQITQYTNLNPYNKWKDY